MEHISRKEYLLYRVKKAIFDLPKNGPIGLKFCIQV